MPGANIYERRPVHPPRKLTSKEEALLSFLLSRQFPGRDQLRQQMRSARVSGECKCGCPTVELLVDRAQSPRAKVVRRMPVEAIGNDEDGTQLYALLHVDDDGFLCELEAYRVDSKPLKLPDPGSLHLLNQGENK